MCIFLTSTLYKKTEAGKEKERNGKLVLHYRFFFSLTHIVNDAKAASRTQGVWEALQDGWKPNKRTTLKN